MAQCKLVALDLDGTLTNSEKVLPKKNKDALFKLQERGVKVVLASGRPTYGIMHLAKELNLQEFGGYIVAYNGSFIIECSTGKRISSTVFPRELLPQIESVAKQLNVEPLTYDDPTDTILAKTSDNKWIQHEAWLNNNMALRIVESLNDSAPMNIPKCLMVGDPDYMGKVEPQVRELFPMIDVYRSSPFFLEIVPKGIDKANSLETLSRIIGIRQEEMAAFGDGHNDINMIKYAGWGVAMSNACDEAKNIADFISLSNDDCGVAHAIKELGL